MDRPAKFPSQVEKFYDTGYLYLYLNLLFELRTFVSSGSTGQTLEPVIKKGTLYFVQTEIMMLVAKIS